MGEVYRATDTALKRQVAIKVLPRALAGDADRLARFQREAEVLASLNHPNIAAIYGLERTNGASALVMELVEGPTLAERMSAGAIPLDEAMSIARQIAAALDAAHERGVVHRDLKPANIKVRPDGTVKLLDFGLAKAVEGAHGPPSGVAAAASLSPTITSPAMTQAGVLLGTAAYMSPEQARGRSADHRSDIWAFGVVLAEMVSGRTLFEGETISDTIAAVLTREPSLDDVPPTLRRLTRLCLAKDPRERLRHIGDAMALVDDAPPPNTVRTTRTWTYAAALIVVAVVAAAAGWLLRRPALPDEAVTRFYLDAPRDGSFNYTYTATAISPDGRHIVFRVATASGAPALWLQPFDSVDAQRIAGTDNGDFPFWSADGTSIGFFAAGKLKRVEITGSAPITIADASDADTMLTGASWNADNVIIFGQPQGIFRVSASGGTPQLIAPVNSAAGETGYGSPQFLPDGDRFLMFVRSDKTADQGLYVSSLARPTEKTRLLNTPRKAFLASGERGRGSYLLYLQERTLLARRVDRATLAFTGDPVPIAPNIALFPPGYQASFWASGAGNVLAYRNESSDRPRLTWILPDGKREADLGTDDFYTHVRVAPDGSRAALELADPSGNMDVWTWDFKRRAKTRQTFDPRPDRGPSWSPNGQQLAFTSLRTGVWQLFVKDMASGRAEAQVTTSAGDKIVPTWSRDGRFLVFIQIGAATAEDIWAVPLDGDRQPFPILQSVAVETNPALSPDGKWLAFESSQTGRPEVLVTRFPTSRTAVDESAPRWQVSTQGGSRPRWSGDGRGLFYVSLDDRNIMRADIRPTGAAFDNDAPRVFAEIPVMPVGRSPFDVTADGRVLLLERTIRGAALTVVTNWRAIMATR